MCVQHGLYVSYPYVSLHQFANCHPRGLDVGYPYNEFALVLPMCVRHRLYVGYSYVGLHWVCLCLSDMGFMWTPTLIWVCIRFARVCPTRALFGLPVCGFASVFPFETHMGFMRATYILCGFALVLSYVGRT